MKTEFDLLGKRLNMATRARRRWLAAVAFGGLALLVVAWFYAKPNTLASWCMILVLLPVLAFTSLTGDSRTRADERDMHRRDHAHFMAYPTPGYVLVAALFASYFRGPNPIIPLMDPFLRAILFQLPYALLIAALILYITLPWAILLWTEPDMEEAR